MPVGYLSLEVRELIIPQMDLPFYEELPSLDGLEALLMFGAPESVPFEVCVRLGGHTGTLFSGALLGPLRGKLSQSHLLQRHVRYLCYLEYIHFL